MLRNRTRAEPTPQPGKDKEKAAKQSNPPPKEDSEPTFIPAENLTCPILAKLCEAFKYASSACHAEKDGDLCPGSRVINGLYSVLECDQCVNQHSGF
jgi:hypothetical protein